MGGAPSPSSRTPSSGYRPPVAPRSSSKVPCRQKIWQKVRQEARTAPVRHFGGGGGGGMVDVGF